ncbi:LrgB family protein [uncultured Acetatifactor sp.]|uniref:LrgB family protein n=1 Tax=uncultured Acetatifactor sp. TaxID=1671927 RepID=UPI002ED3C98A
MSRGGYCDGDTKERLTDKGIDIYQVLQDNNAYMALEEAGGLSGGGRPLSYLMTPATICLGISFAEQVEKLKKHMAAIIVGVAAGTVCSLSSVAGMAYLFGMDRVMTISVLPKSVTTAIGVAISEQAGGIGAVTAAAIILTGILGNMAGPVLTKVFHIEDEIAQGVAYGTASHVIGTSRAMERSPLAGAAGSLALTVAGLLTSLFFSVL